MAQQADIGVYRGKAATITVTVTDASGSVVNVTGWHGVFTLRDKFDGTILIQQAFTVSSGPGGILTVPLTAAQTTLDPDTYPYDVSRTDAANEDLISIGQFFLLPGVTT